MIPSDRGRRLAGMTAAALLTVLPLTACTDNASKPSASASASAQAGASSTADARVVQLIKTGIDQAQAGKYDEATTTFNNVLVIDPGNKFAFYNLGLIAQTRGDSKTAIDNYDKALKSDPNFQSALYNKAILLESTDLDQSISIYKKIVDTNPNASTAWYRLSLAYAAKGDTNNAKAAHDKAVALDPNIAQLPTTYPTPSAPAPSASPSK